MKITKELKKFLNSRIEKMIQEGTAPEKIKVGWTEKIAYWAQKINDTYHLKSGIRFPKNIATPKELNVDIGIYQSSLSGIIENTGTVSSMI